MMWSKVKCYTDLHQVAPADIAPILNAGDGGEPKFCRAVKVPPREDIHEPARPVSLLTQALKAYGSGTCILPRPAAVPGKKPAASQPTSTNLPSASVTQPIKIGA